MADVFEKNVVEQGDKYKGDRHSHAATEEY